MKHYNVEKMDLDAISLHSPLVLFIIFELLKMFCNLNVIENCMLNDYFFHIKNTWNKKTISSYYDFFQLKLERKCFIVFLVLSENMNQIQYGFDIKIMSYGTFL